MTIDATAELRRSLYLILTTVAVAIATAKVVGVENVVEPSRFAPPPGKFGSDRLPEQIPVRAWPSVRPEPTPMFGSNDRSRWATVRALVDDGTYVIGRRPDVTRQEPPYGDTGIIFDDDSWRTIDHVMNPATGEVISSKPPLFATLMAGEYWLLKHLFGWSIVRDRWYVVIAGLLTVNVLPFAVYLVLLSRLVEHYGRTDFGRLLTFTAAALGTFALTFSNTLNNHTPAVFCTLFAIYPLVRPKSAGRPETAGELFVSGLFAGVTATFELPAAGFVAGLLLPLLVRRTRLTVLAFLPGVLIPVGALVACNFAAMGSWQPAYGEFGGPWYMYPGSHWQNLLRPNARGIDFNTQGTPIYAFNLLIGHHGWFSLQPVWLVGLIGLIALSRRGVGGELPKAVRVWSVENLARLTLVVWVVVFVFYLTRTKSYNYGGNTSCARWLMWLSPLWLIGLMAGADRLARSPWGRRLAVFALGVSVLSVFYPAWNPWRSPWLLQFAEMQAWVNY